MTFHFTLLYIIVYSCRFAEVFVSPTSAPLKERILTEFGDARSALYDDIVRNHCLWYGD